jgi:O-methyltransferase
MNLNNFIKIVSPYTMTSVDRISELFYSLEYIRNNNIDGDIVECGVWKGGNILGIIEYLKYHKIENINVWLYDTFQGMTQPEDIDIDFKSKKASDQMDKQIVLAYSSIDEVKQNVLVPGIDHNRIKFIVGDVSETLKIEGNIPDKISLLRLDTDWYQSTKDELYYLYPKLNDKGVLIVDDYGHWMGAKKAVDEYFNDKDIILEKIDYTGIKITKKIN